jgi:7-carboxy-7-deazaguanine synthase
VIPINKQQPQKAERHPLGWLYVHSIFYTIQGEGPFVGRPAVFIRLAGCNLQCPGCDTEYSEGAKLLEPKRIAELAYKAPLGTLRSEKRMPLVVITGGEPFRQNLVPLICELLDKNLSVQIETNGTLWDENVDSLTAFSGLSIVCSPKAGKIAIPTNAISALKYVVSYDAIDLTDGLPTSVLGMPAAPARPPSDYYGPVYVQPADEQSDKHSKLAQDGLNLKAAIDSCMQFGYQLCIQTHKIIGMD